MLAGLLVTSWTASYDWGCCRYIKEAAPSKTIRKFMCSCSYVKFPLFVLREVFEIADRFGV